jgi:ABC-2 type transport system ATP-binding protein
MVMIVETSGLRKVYGSTPVLDGIDLEVRAGEVFALLGPNGAGKTTTIRVLSTLTRPDGGSARVAGYDVVRQAAEVRAAISLTGQSAAVDAEQTGHENLVVAGRLMHLGRRGAARRATELLERFDLVEAGSRRVRTYSGGMLRRLDLAMSLVATPRVIFLDEPTTGLDPASRTTMWDAITELVRGGTTILLTTQYLEEADRLADRIVLVDRGRVVAAGTPDGLKTQVGGERVVLRFADPRALDRATGLLAAAGAVASAERLELAVASDGSAVHLHRLLDELRTAAVPVVRVTSHRPTLDDVFMALTARPADRTSTPA